ncbi:hypothetical protein ANRL2_03427 [Anaerolineae bacterium]|nr:hypothetical protein ANRL2_03427 [Anaerolineae bacterium]
MALGYSILVVPLAKSAILKTFRKAIGEAKSIVQDESGHTLAETLVALTLFTAVLIPLLTAIGSLTIDDKAERTQEALRIAQAELASSGAPGASEGDTQHTEHGLQVFRRITRHGELIETEVIVADTRKGGRTIVHLARTSVQARSR